ncbi:MAG TPA: 23S rRNA (adenine(2503)-C(2))-methyltransferase RlmN [Nitrospira sp.]|nr:23S rRNA (adenine(2503)-C(2))-methyltransferase RlmN [Nitrospira sp.]
MNLLSLTEPEMAQFVRRQGWPRYRTVQILRWLHQRRARTIAEMTDLSRQDREVLGFGLTIERPVVRRLSRSVDGTRKLLVGLADGLTVEAVMIPDDDRLTVCLSTQVGCTLDCDFCLTGTLGLKRNLKAYEIVEQVSAAQDYLEPGERLTNLVFMGMGEPLANLENLAEAINRLTNHSWGLGWSPRRMTVSSAGMASRLEELASLGVNVAISLNATSEDQRWQLMPAIQRIASLSELLAACRRYPLAPGRRLTFEYVLLSNVNDRPDDARRLVNLVRGVRCKINLIPFNEFPGTPYRRPTDEAILRFQSLLKRAGLEVFIRKSRGQDVLGACGQLGDVPSVSTALTQIESRC